MKNKPAQRHITSELRELLNWYPISEQKAFQAARVHRTTWQRWLDGKSKIPPATLELIKITVRGDICDDAFSGFYVTNGHLVDDCGRIYTPGDIRASQYFKSLAMQYLALQKTHDFVPKRHELEITPASLGQPENLQTHPQIAR